MMSKQTKESKAFEKYLRAIPVGQSRQWKRLDSVITFDRLNDGVGHCYGRGAMYYTGTFRQVADWFTADDGQGEWTELEIGYLSTLGV